MKGGVAWLDGAFAELEENHLVRRPARVEWLDGMRARVDGKTVVVFCANDYLGFSRDEQLRRADLVEREAHGGSSAWSEAGSSGSRLITGTSPAHEALEREVAAWKGDDAALLFGSGYLANIGAIPALVGAPDAIFSDELNHASLIDGCRLSRAEIVVIPHRDTHALIAALSASTHRRRLVVTESVFSMEGDEAPLVAWVEAALRYGAMTVVDEAHAAGLVGEHGAGLVRALGLTGRVTAAVTTFGKALGCEGAAVSGARRVVEWLRNRARSFVYSTAPSPRRVAALREAVRMAYAAEKRRARVKTLANRFRAQIGEDALGGEHGFATPIVPVRVGDAARTLAWGAALLDQGFFVQAIRPPTVPPGTSRLRVTFSALHSEADVDGVAAAIRGLRARM